MLHACYCMHSHSVHAGHIYIIIKNMRSNDVFELLYITSPFTMLY